jgi:nucleotide-binding universal stress UspA family protein
MLSCILAALDGSRDSDPALELGIRWAKRFDAQLVGLAVVDEPGIHGIEELLVGEAYFHGLNQSLLADELDRRERTLRGFTARCDGAGVASRPLEGIGTPHVKILEEAQRYDLILLGRRTHFRFGSQVEPDGTPSKVLKDSPRPVVIVPPGPVGGEAVVVAYDGSLQAARALATFEATGLGRDREVEVVSVGPDAAEPSRCADRAAEFLRSHGVAARALPLASGGPPAAAILERVRQRGAGLLVMGAYGQPTLREFFLGSTTRTMMAESPVPVFLDH